MRKYIYCLMATMLCTPWCSANDGKQPGAHYEKADSVAIVGMLAHTATDGGECLQLRFARQLLNRPYVAHTLELFPDGERLVVNTRQLDCTTLVETVTALTICKQNGKKTFADYCNTLQQLRYRQGRLSGYTSRLHYFSDWIDDKTKMGLVAEVQMKQAPFTKVQQLNIGYMSKHPTAYTALKRHPELVKTIATQEKALTGRQYRYIPKEEVKNTALLRSVVRDGDILAITTSKAGLDIAHLGFSVWKKDGLHLLNASMIHKKVVEETKLLSEYLAEHPSFTGIRVIRIKKN